MNELGPIKVEHLLSSLPPLWEDDGLRLQIAQHLRESNRCVVALDDDPTGTQTVHDIWVLTSWEVDEICEALADGEPAIYMLTNTRSMSLSEATLINRTIAKNLTRAAKEVSRSVTVVSRSDSTLRGHYPGEVQALADELTKAYGAPFDGVCIIPFFPEGGRFTINDVHWVQEGEELIPVAQTAYAQDAVFGYRHSFLPKWVEEKTEGAVAAHEVLSVSIETIRRGGPNVVADQLSCAKNGQILVVNAANYRDLEVFVYALQTIEALGKRFLFRTAASFVKVAAGLPDRPLLSVQKLVSDRPSQGGLIVFGSYVPKSTAQLSAACTLEGVTVIELPVLQVLKASVRDKIITRIIRAINSSLSAGSDTIIFTSREHVRGHSHSENLAIGHSISSALAEIIKRIEYEPRYIIGKGGITSSDLATKGMGVHAARVVGQILPGVPVWLLGPRSRWPGLPYIVFPGNVGDKESVAELVWMLRG